MSALATAVVGVGAQGYRHAQKLAALPGSRFNPVVLALAGRVMRPQFIESVRVAPYKPRALDVSVVLDLMIHDIDLIHTFVRSPMAHVDAIGRRVFTDNLDVANARITFANGCVANVTSSRISSKTERTLRIFRVLRQRPVAQVCRCVRIRLAGNADVFRLGDRTRPCWSRPAAMARGRITLRPLRIRGEARRRKRALRLSLAFEC